MRYTKHAALATPLLLLSSCGGNPQKTTADVPMDEDFDPSCSHPFASRTEVTTGERLTAADIIGRGDTLGALVLSQQTTVHESLLESCSFCDTLGNTGTLKCGYNSFLELTDLWVEMPRQRMHCMLQWDENGNLSMLNREEWSRKDDAAAELHTMEMTQYEYTNRSAYGNWYAGMAERIGGPVAVLLHRGLLGRAPWTLPEAWTCVSSEIAGDVIGQQQTLKCRPAFEFDNNGCVTRETLQAAAATQTFEYCY